MGGVEGGALEGAHGGARLDEVHAVKVGSDGGKLTDDLGTDGERVLEREGRERTRRMSPMRVPRPGPSSTIRKGFEPADIHRPIIQRAST